MILHPAVLSGQLPLLAPDTDRALYFLIAIQQY